MERYSGSFICRDDKKIYYLFLLIFIGLGVLTSIGLILYDNPVDPSSPSFMPVIRRRLVALVAMLIAAVCQSLATVTFQTITANRVITPSLLGFESLYSAIHTSTIYFFGASALIDFTGLRAFSIQLIIMMGLSLVLYGTLLRREESDIDTMLLIGVVLGQGLRSLSSFMRRLLSPSEFDILQARLFASVNHADEDYFPLVIPLIIVTSIVLFSYCSKLNVLSLGREISTNLGLNYRNDRIGCLVIVSILTSISTALVGPMTFFGFLLAAMTYQIVPSYDHKYILPMSIALGFVILTVAYFFVNHIFNAQGVVTIVIELFGGLAFLITILRRGDL